MSYCDCIVPLQNGPEPFCLSCGLPMRPIRFEFEDLKSIKRKERKRSRRVVEEG